MPNGRYTVTTERCTQRRPSFFWFLANITKEGKMTSVSEPQHSVLTNADDLAYSLFQSFNQTSRLLSRCNPAMGYPAMGYPAMGTVEAGIRSSLLENPDLWKVLSAENPEPELSNFVAEART